MEHTFALSLWSLVDRSKVDPASSDLRGLARQLGRWLAHNHGVHHKGTAIEEPDGARAGADPLLVVAGVPSAHWPALLALARTQRATLYLVLRDADGVATLRPVALPAD